MPKRVVHNAAGTEEYFRGGLRNMVLRYEDPLEPAGAFTTSGLVKNRQALTKKLMKLRNKGPVVSADEIITSIEDDRQRE